MGNFAKIFGLLYQGRQVADPAAWKRGAISVNVLVAALAALVEILRIADVPIAVTTEQLGAIAGGVLALFNVVAAVAGNSSLGLPNRSEAPIPPAAGANAAGQTPVDDAARNVGQPIDPGPG
jgi:hypothetical protein